MLSIDQSSGNVITLYEDDAVARLMQVQSYVDD